MRPITAWVMPFIICGYCLSCAASTFIDLGTYNEDPYSHAVAVNNSDQVAGNSYATGYPNSSTAFVYEQNTLSPLDTSSGNVTTAVAINASGQILGNWQNDDGTAGGTFFYNNTNVSYSNDPNFTATALNVNGEGIGTLNILVNPSENISVHHGASFSSGQVTDLGTLGGLYSAALGINSSGEIVGNSTTTNDPVSPTHAFVYNPGSGMVDLGTLGGDYSSAVSINDAGDIAGYSAVNGTTETFLYTASDGMVDITPDLAGSQAVAINSTDEIAGTAQIDGANHAFLYAGGTVHDLGDFSTFGGIGSQAIAMNNDGDVVGYIQLSSGSDDYFLYNDGTGSEIDISNALPVGWTNFVFNAFNDSDEVVGEAVDPSGFGHAVELSFAVPEPASASIVISLAAGALLRRRARRRL